MNIVINGDFHGKRITGVQRYAFEMVKALDDIIKYEENLNIELLMPEGYPEVPQLKKIKVVKYGKDRKFLWQQFSLMNYCRQKCALCVCMCSVVPFFYAQHSVGVIHDAATLVHPEFYSLKYILYNRIFMWGTVNRLRKVVTVSDFSKSEIDRYWTHGKRDIIVIPNAANHMEKLREDVNVFEKYAINQGKYYYTLSSLSPNKNYRWVIEIARRNPQCPFLISGMDINIFSKNKIDDIPPNVKFTGYISDEEMVALIKHCKLFLFPTLYEGFGLTPLEALAVGSKVLVSDTPCMHEVYGDSALYIDPYRYDYNLDEIFIQAKEMETNINNKYSWTKSAKKFIELFEKIAETK